MSGGKGGDAERLERVNRYLTIGIALLAITIVLLLVSDFA